MRRLADAAPERVAVSVIDLRRRWQAGPSGHSPNSFVAPPGTEEQR